MIGKKKGTKSLIPIIERIKQKRIEDTLLRIHLILREKLLIKHLYHEEGRLLQRKELTTNKNGGMVKIRHKRLANMPFNPYLCTE